MIQLADESKARLIEQERTFLNSCRYRLFVNDHEPSGLDTVDDYEQLVAGGYSAGGTAPNFLPAQLDAEGRGYLQAYTLTWIFTGSGLPVIIYGYYVVHPPTGRLVMAERAPEPIAISLPGQTFSVTPYKLMTTYDPGDGGYTGIIGG